MLNKIYEKIHALLEYIFINICKENEDMFNMFFVMIGMWLGILIGGILIHFWR